MYILYSLISAVSSGFTTIFAKKSVNNNPHIVGFIRTIIVFFITFIYYILFSNSSNISVNNLILVIISGIFTFLLWINYFKALSIGEVYLVSPTDKVSIIITYFISLLLGEVFNIFKLLFIILLILGIYLMIYKKSNNYRCIKYALLTGMFTSLSSIFIKDVLECNDSFYVLFIRTFIVLIIYYIYAFKNKIYKDIYNIKDYKSIILSGIFTSLSWLFFFKALSIGNVNVVFSIEKLSILFSLINSFNKFKLRNYIGLILIIISEIVIVII